VVTHTVANHNGFQTLFEKNERWCLRDHM